MWIARSETKTETNEETKTMATQTISVKWTSVVSGGEFPSIEVPTDFDATVKISGPITRKGLGRASSLREMLAHVRDVAETEIPVEVTRTLRRQKGSNAKKNPYSGVDWQEVDVYIPSKDGASTVYLEAKTTTYFPTKGEAMNARHRYHSAVSTATLAVARADDAGEIEA